MRSPIAIVGAGIAGLSTAWHLARAGVEGLVLFEAEPAIALHSTRLNAAILRTWSPDPVLCALAAKGAEFLREPTDGFADGPLCDRRGLVLANSRTSEELRTDYALVRGAVPRFEALDERAFRELAPHFASLRELGDRRAFHFPDEGRIDLARLTDAFERALRRLGVQFRTGCKIAELSVRSGRVVGVRTERGETHPAGTVVLAAGAWAGTLGRRAGSRVELRPTSRHLVVARVRGLAVSPEAPIVWSDAARFYARPEDGGLLLCACDQHDCDPDDLVRDPGELARCLERARRALPGAVGFDVEDWWVGTRTLTRDGLFSIGPDPDVEGLAWVAGLGGHGITAAAGFGEFAARRLLGDPTDDVLAGALDPGRGARTAG